MCLKRLRNTSVPNLKKRDFCLSNTQATTLNYGHDVLVRRLRELGREAHTPLPFHYRSAETYESVYREQLLSVFARFGVPVKVIRVSGSSTIDTQACVRLDNGDCSEGFGVRQGLRRRCVLSPLLFNIFCHSRDNRLKADADALDGLIRIKRRE
ncbi:unnamed protein product [Discosporangium mesarthrocarpum]